MDVVYLSDNRILVAGVSEFLDCFKNTIEASNYKVIPYNIWRDLRSRPNLEIIYDGTEIIEIYNGYSQFLSAFSIDDNSLGEYIYYNYFKNTPEEFLKKEKVKERKEMKNFNFNFDFGSCADDSVRMSMYGIAIKNANGVYVSYDSKSQKIIDVDIMNFDGGKYMFKVPVALRSVSIGDVVIHNRKPMFVTDVNKEGNDITVIDIYNGEKKEIIPTTNMFNFNFVTKVVSLLNMCGFNAPSEDMPFGNMLPFILASENTDFDPMMMYFAMNGGNSNFNPAMFFLMKDDASNNDMIKMMLLSSFVNGNNGFFNPNGMPNASITTVEMPVSIPNVSKE